MTKATKTQTADLLDAIAEANGEMPCECQRFEIEIWTGDVPEGADPGNYVEYTGTGCQSTTTRTFAPGHDAKLKSLLIQAGMNSDSVRRGDGGLVILGDAVTMAGAYGFETQVASGIQRAIAKRAASYAKKLAKSQAREAREALKEAAKLAKAAAKAADQPVEVAPLIGQVSIKVGRWTYKAIINPADNSAEYTSSNGATKVAEEGKYAIVTA